MSSANDTTATVAPATVVDYLKYIIDDVTDMNGADSVSEFAIQRFEDLSSRAHVTAADAEKAKDYGYKVVSSHIATLNKLRKRVEDFPESFGKQTNADLRQLRYEHGRGWDNKRGLETPIGEGQPFVRACQLVDLIVEKTMAQDEIKLLEEELQHRLGTAKANGWLPPDL